MAYEWDTAKDASNTARHGVSFSAMEGFDWDTAMENEDTADYGEQRFTGLGFIGYNLFVVVFTWRGDNRRIISLRRATKKEERIYAEYN